MSAFQFGIDHLLTDHNLQKGLEGQRWGLLAHPASVTSDLTHTLDALKTRSKLNITCAFGPQHGMRGEKQYNMVESDDYVDPIHKIPVFSLYGKIRRPSQEQLNHCDGAIIDLQDVGCRIYTYITSMFYVMQECASRRMPVVVLDRPNPAGRAMEGSILRKGNESFVGLGPILMRHGHTLGEMAKWMNQHFNLGAQLQVVPMNGYDPTVKPGYGWPVEGRAWVNPSPNMPNLACARVYAGTVMLEGTHLSEGRGTTRPLEVLGAPDIDGLKILKEMERLEKRWLEGAYVREHYFQPTFYKHQDKLCSGIQIHVDHDHYDPMRFKPYRMVALAFKSIRTLYPEYQLWRDFPYEYVFDRLAIDVITGCDTLRKWVDDKAAKPADLEVFLHKDELEWKKQVQNAKIY
ncbi:MAG: DUF1343 domain-containing protein [Bdellovibrionales bacterium]|nr:DUF1343 domain-containing protein [Bdellovibrionales bacterium]